MTLDQILTNYIKANLTYTGTFVYGSAEGTTAPYIVLTKVSDLEQPEVLCDTQGDSGRALFQFSAYTEGGPGFMVEYLNDFKEQVKNIRGVIGSAPDEVRINNNITNGVSLIGDGASTQGVWGAIFETELWWEYI